MIESELSNRLQEQARKWGVVVEDTVETQSSLIGFGTRNVLAADEKQVDFRAARQVREGFRIGGHNQSVVLKVIKQRGDEWHSGEVLKAFDGHGVVRIHEHAPGAVLMERLLPGTPLLTLALSGRDEEATDILANVICEMSETPVALSSITSVESPLDQAAMGSPAPPTHSPETPGFTTVQDWAKGFERYLATGDKRIPESLVQAGHRMFIDLAASQRELRLLHGDLQHYNVLFDSDRGWVAIDPKGVIGEVEFEIGAILRNPIEKPDLFLSPKTIERRLEQLTNRLSLNPERALSWAFAQAVLSAIWEIEDGFALPPTNPSLRLANVLRPMIAAGGKSHA